MIPRRRPGRRAGRGDHPEVVVLRLPHGRRPRAPRRPDRRQRPLLAEPRLVLEPDLDPLIGVGAGDLDEPVVDFFLNSSCAAGSALMCRGPGSSGS